MRVPIVVVGGGLTGLVLLHHLRREDADVLLMEAGARPGGVMGTHRTPGGPPLELGPQRARLTPAFLSLVRELGLEEELVRAPPGLPLLVHSEGRLRRVPFSLREAVRTDLLSAPAKLRVLMEPLRKGPRPDEPVGGFLRRAFGEEAYRVLLGPLYGGLYASDPDRMIVRHSLGRLLAERGLEGRSLLVALLRGSRKGPPPAAVSFRDGLGTLPRAIARLHRDRIRFSTPVREVRPAGRGDGAWVVATDDGDRVADQVILTAPARAAGEILRGVAPDAAARLGRLRYNPLALVHLVASGTVPAAGFQVAFGEDTPLRGVTSHGALFDRAGLHTAFLGGMGREEVVEWSDERIGREAAEAFHRMAGLDARAVHVHRTWMPAWDRSWDAMEGLTLPPGIRVAGNWHARPGIPGRLREARQLAGSALEGPGTGAALDSASSRAAPG